MPNKKRPIDLASLYPAPKTYEQKEAEREALKKKQLARQPQHIGLQSAAGLSVVFVYTLWISIVIPAMVHSDPMIGVPFMFLLGLVWCGLVLWIGKDVINLLQVKGFNPAPFLLVYSACVTPMVALGIIDAVPTGFMAVLALTTVHFLVVWLLIVVASTKKLTNAKKITILSVTWVVAFIAVVVLTMRRLLT
jgi:hypothetical protein